MRCTFAKLLSRNDTAQGNNQAGPLIPRSLAPFFPELDESQKYPRVSLQIELLDGDSPLEVVEAKLIWYKSKSEYHLTNIRPIIPLWTQDDAIRFERIGFAEYRLQLVRQGSELWEEIAEHTIYPGRCGLLLGDIQDFENLKVATAPRSRRKRGLHNQEFDVEKFQREAEDKFSRRKRNLSTILHDPDKTSMRTLQHDECVTRLAKSRALRTVKKTAGKQTGIDLKAEGEDIIAIFEIKTLRGDEMRQFRTATGQLNHYSFETSLELGNADRTIHRVICTDRRPDKHWQDYATSWNIGVIWLPEKSNRKKKSREQEKAEKPGATTLGWRMLHELTNAVAVC